LEKAIALGVPTIKEMKFREMLGLPSEPSPAKTVDENQRSLI
jgi:hypothetical protein